MPDDSRRIPPEEPPPSAPIPPQFEEGAPDDDTAASTIFVEMMRQVAARRATLSDAPPAPPKTTTPNPASVPPTSTPPAPPTPVNTASADEAVRPSAVPSAQERARRARERRLERALNAQDDGTEAEQAREWLGRLIKSKETPPPKDAPRHDAPTPAPAPMDTRVPPTPPREPSPSPALTRPAPSTLHSPPPAPNPAPAVEDAEDELDDAMRVQQIQRIKRRQERTRQRRAGFFGGFTRTILVLLVAAGLASTIFTWFTQPDFLSRQVVSGLVVAQSTVVVTTAPTSLPTPNYLKRIGIVSGHRGPQNDPGAVCPDGLTEAEINFNVASAVVRQLRSLGYTTDLLDEFDQRLEGYSAAAMVSIHANTCRDWGERVSGFIVAKAAARPEGGLDTLLAECIGEHYGIQVPLERRFSLTRDMTDYHSFREINALTPAAIIELGFMKDDREVLTTQVDEMARGIVDGILCFLRPETRPTGNVILVTPGFDATPTPSLSPTP